MGDAITDQIEKGEIHEGMEAAAEEVMGTTPGSKAKTKPRVHASVPTAAKKVAKAKKTAAKK